MGVAVKKTLYSGGAGCTVRPVNTPQQPKSLAVRVGGDALEIILSAARLHQLTPRQAVEALILTRHDAEAKLTEARRVLHMATKRKPRTPRTPKGAAQ